MEVTLACQNELALRNATINPALYCGFKIWCSNKIKDILIMCIMTILEETVSEDIKKSEENTVRN